MRRGIVLMTLAAMLLAAMAAPAAATRAPAPGADPAEGHKITICHATRSLSNPYVEITIDVAAWNDPSDPNHHGDHHTRTKDGVTWQDYILGEGEECGLPTLPTCEDADAIKILFDGDALISTVSGLVNLTEPGLSAVDIPTGNYAVLLGSSDTDGIPTEIQDNEQWRAVFSNGVVTPFSDDLPDDTVIRFNETDVGTFSFSGATTVVAEHWDFANTSLSADSVIPEYVCLLPRTLDL